MTHASAVKTKPTRAPRVPQSRAMEPPRPVGAGRRDSRLPGHAHQKPPGRPRAQRAQDSIYVTRGLVSPPEGRERGHLFLQHVSSSWRASCGRWRGDARAITRTEGQRGRPRRRCARCSPIAAAPDRLPLRRRGCRAGRSAGRSRLAHARGPRNRRTRGAAESRTAEGDACGRRPSAGAGGR